MELKKVVERMVEMIKEIDDNIEHGRASTKKWGQYLGGIGSAYEPDIVAELVKNWNLKFSDSRTFGEVSYPEKELTIMVSGIGDSIFCKNWFTLLNQ